MDNFEREALIQAVSTSVIECAIDTGREWVKEHPLDYEADELAGAKFSEAVLLGTLAGFYGVLDNMAKEDSNKDAIFARLLLKLKLEFDMRSVDRSEMI